MNNNLTIKYLINMLNEHLELNINRQIFLIDSYPSLKFNYDINSDILLYILLIAYKNIKYIIDPQTFKIIIDKEIIDKTKLDIIKYLSKSTNITIKKIREDNILSNNIITNEIILIFTYYFSINLIIYNSQSQISKCYYYENILDRELPFIIIKEINNNYELLVLNDKYLFEFNHPIINELINDVYVVGFDKNKKLELSKDKLNIKQDLIDIKPIIKLPLVPMRILNFLKNYNIYRNKNILFNKKYKLNLININ
jgi:hypothetical protein